jgi:H+/gluconate symporter-like permease
MLILPKKGGAGAVQFLVERFTILGFEGQNWMLILIGVVAAFLFFVWKTRDRI